MLSVFSALILPVGRQEGHLAYKKVGCWFVGGDNLTGALHYIAPVFTTTSIIFAPVKSRMVVFCFRLSWVVLENGVLLLYHVVVLCLLSRAQASSDTSLCHGFSLYICRCTSFKHPGCLSSTSSPVLHSALQNCT